MNNNIYREDYFIYKGVVYGTGTKVIFKDELYDDGIRPLKAKGQPYTFFAGYNNGWKRFSWPDKEQWSPTNCDGYDKQQFDPDDIKEIVKPVYVNLVPVWQKALDNACTGRVSASIFGGVLLYLMVMVGGAIFNDRLLIWIATTIIFVGWLIKQYRD